MGGPVFDKFNVGAIMRKRASIITTLLKSRSDAYKADLTAKFTADVMPAFANGTLKPIVDRVIPFAWDDTENGVAKVWTGGGGGVYWLTERCLLILITFIHTVERSTSRDGKQRYSRQDYHEVSQHRVKQTTVLSKAFEADVTARRMKNWLLILCLFVVTVMLKNFNRDVCEYVLGLPAC